MASTHQEVDSPNTVTFGTLMFGSVLFSLFTFSVLFLSLFIADFASAANVDICVGSAEFCDKADREAGCPNGMKPGQKNGISICIDIKSKKRGEQKPKEEARPKPDPAEKPEVKQTPDTKLDTEKCPDGKPPKVVAGKKSCDRAAGLAQINAKNLLPAKSSARPFSPTKPKKAIPADGEREVPTKRYPTDKQPPNVVPHVLVALKDLKTWPNYPEAGAQPTGEIKKGQYLDVIKYYQYDRRDKTGHVYEVKVMQSASSKAVFIQASDELTQPSSETLGDIDTAGVKKFDVTSPNQRRPVRPFEGGGACAQIKEKIRQNSASYTERKIVKTSFVSKGKRRNHPGITKYFTPIFKNLTSMHRKKPYKYWCKNIEGACIVGQVLHAYGKSQVDLSDEKCKFGFGNGGANNKTNCLDPCVTVAADQSHPHLKSGTVLYIPKMDGAVCPQNGTRTNGCFIVNDVGSWIKGPGNFDIFAGECFEYEAGVCKDFHMSSFKARAGNKYYAIPPDDNLAKEYRLERDQVIQSEWK